ncbi:NAD(P)H-quinone oxidoreductase [Nocardioides zeicaulis]|uniref:NAD(P)H-quinone oxidoreductase n=1 Tax=Nocardioides zeicaulis TaxID=1776857 RepID=A0ABV6E2F0_9ACTN
MRAITIAGRGDEATLELVEVPDPRVEPHQVLVDVIAAGVNRADTVQRRGTSLTSAGTSRLPGLEVAGLVAATGSDVRRWAVGDRVCALLTDGGYAERVAVDADHVLAVPDAVDLVDAAALPEALATVWSNLVGLAGLRAGETLLVHGGGSGIGTTAIQVARLLGARVIVTAGSRAKLDACLELGADEAIDYRTGSFVDAVHDLTDGRGVDVVLDIIGASYLASNLAAVATGGRVVVIGLQSGASAELDLREVLRKRAVVTGSLVRPRPAEEKARILAEVAAHVMPAVADGRVRPVVDSRMPLADAWRAHARLEASEHIGKILLTTGEELP